MDERILYVAVFEQDDSENIVWSIGLPVFVYLAHDVSLLNLNELS